MRARGTLVTLGTLLAVATLVLAGYELTQRFGGEGDALGLLALIGSIATALLCIGVLDWAQNLVQGEPEPKRRSSPVPVTRRREEPVVDPQEAEFAALVRALEQAAHSDRGADASATELMKTITGYVRSSAATLWTVVHPEPQNAEGEPAEDEPSEATQAGAPVHLKQRAHHESDRVFLGEKMPQDEPPGRAWHDVVERRATLTASEERSARFLVPVVGARRCIALLRLVVPQGGSIEERRQAAEQTGKRLDQLARLLGRVLEAPTLYDEAVHDTSTGLYTRRHMATCLDEACGACLRYGEPLSLVVLELDKLERLNRRHGQTTGDRAMASVAGLVLDNIRRCDTAYRYDEDQVALLLPHTDQDSACVVAERLSRTVRDTRVLADDGSEVIVTVTGGVAEFNEDMPRANVLLEQAEQALRHAKGRGRNRIEAWKPPAEADAPAVN
jgi:diguanylate cyclase (GGDEF)-like protein